MMWGDGWGLLGALMMLIFWGGLLAVVVFLVRGFGVRSSQREEKRRTDAREVLAERFARGEISEEEFEQRRRVLERSSS
jgi:putative membrane protein